MNFTVNVTMVSRNKRKYIRHLLKFLLPYAPKRVYLFGSWARDGADELSDLGIVIIKRTPLPFLDRIREVLSLLPRELGTVDVLVYIPEEWTPDEGSWQCLRRNGGPLAALGGWLRRTRSLRRS